MGVSKNRGTPKSSILIGFSIIFPIHFGVPLFLETLYIQYTRSSNMFRPLPFWFSSNTAEETLITMQSKYSKVDVAVLMAVATGEMLMQGVMCVCQGLSKCSFFLCLGGGWNNEHVTWMHFLLVMIFCVPFCHDLATSLGTSCIYPYHPCMVDLHTFTLKINQI